MTSGNGILYLEVASPGSLRQLLVEQTHDPSRAEFWLHHGCVYVDGIRRREDFPIHPHQIVRLHTNPKSYFWERQPLKERIVFDHPEFFVLDKPTGLPVHPTLDNYIDNAKYLLEQELGSFVYTTHRLDVPTQGLLIFAKTPSAQTLINRLFSERRVEKIYLAWTENPVAIGEHLLFINPASRVPRESSFSPQEKWWECRLEVVESEPDGAGSYKNRIRLITGKTHQIRAQLSALGAPIIGDATYGSELSGHLRLECHSLSFQFRSEHFTIQKGV